MRELMKPICGHGVGWGGGGGGGGRFACDSFADNRCFL